MLHLFVCVCVCSLCLTWFLFSAWLSLHASLSHTLCPFTPCSSAVLFAFLLCRYISSFSVILSLVIHHFISLSNTHCPLVPLPSAWLPAQPARSLCWLVLSQSDPNSQWCPVLYTLWLLKLSRSKDIWDHCQYTFQHISDVCDLGFIRFAAMYKPLT